MTAIILDDLLHQKAHQFAHKELAVISPVLRRPINDVFTESYDSLNNVEKYIKALALLSYCQNKVDFTKLEEAAIILDHLSKTTKDIPIYEALTFVHALAGRFSEAHDALEKTRQLGNKNEYHETLDQILNTKNLQLREQINSLHFNPEKSYVINYEPGKEDVIKGLLKEENIEVVAVVDNIGHIPELRKNFEHSLYTIETESKIHEVYTPRQSSVLRIILKNSNSTITEKGLNLGIRKTKQDLTERIFTINDEGKSSSLSNYINSRPTLAKIINSKKKNYCSFWNNKREYSWSPGSDE